MFFFAAFIQSDGIIEMLRFDEGDLLQVCSQSKSSELAMFHLFDSCFLKPMGEWIFENKQASNLSKSKKLLGLLELFSTVCFDVSRGSGSLNFCVGKVVDFTTGSVWPVCPGFFSSEKLGDALCLRLILM